VKEISTVTNIKDKNNMKNVLTALKSIQIKLQTYKECPSTGIAIFAGYCL